MELINIDHRGGRYEFLLEQAYNSNISTDDVVDYIEQKRQAILSERRAETEGLHKIIEDFGPVTCGLRNDRIDDIVKAIVRDKSIDSIEELRSRITDDFIPRIESYILWSFYNQTTNDLIEHYFIGHQNVVPTLRKIRNIDFFLRVRGTLIPFDLKITHISEDFFDMYSQGLIPNPTEHPDAFRLAQNRNSETRSIKAFYRVRKSRLSLPNYGSFSKKELLDALLASQDKESIRYVKTAFETRKAMIGDISSDLEKLEWWNFKYQGERLFANNNRLFLFFAYTDAFEDGRPIKGKLSIIKGAVQELLDDIENTPIHTIRYLYEKDPALTGDYRAQALSLLITDSKQ
ncbi:MAG: hypothetical protein GX997_07400 [Bacteroidales bacterium]|nr:hypothetical protein [Bacteroidales bacterium]